MVRSHFHQVWQLGSSISNFTLEGHEKGVNCVDYYHGGDKPYLISGADDRLVKIWDYQNKTCVQTLEGMWNLYWLFIFIWRTFIRSRTVLVDIVSFTWLLIYVLCI